MSDFVDHFYGVVQLAKNIGYHDVVRWMMKHLAEEEKAAKPHRAKKAHVVNPVTGQVIRGKRGELMIDLRALRDAEASVRLDRGCTQSDSWTGEVEPFDENDAQRRLDEAAQGEEVEDEA